MKSKIFLRLFGIAAIFSLNLMCDKQQKSEQTQQSVSSTMPDVKVAANDSYSYRVSVFRRNASWSKDDLNYASVSNGLVIDKGAWTETGELSSMTLQGTLGDVVMMGERAKVRLLVDELLDKSSGKTLVMRGLQLARGVARFSIHKDPAGFMVQTPSAIVKVKGTQFVVSCDEKTGKTDVLVQEGVVEVQDKNHPENVVILTAGESIAAVGGESAPVKKRMAKADYTVFRQFDSDSEQIATTLDTTDHSSQVTREKFEKENARKSSPLISAARANAQEALDNERLKSTETIDSVRENYSEAVAQEKQNFEKYKDSEKEKVTNTRESSNAALEKERTSYQSKVDTLGAGLDAERQKYRKATESSTTQSNSSDAFDELRKRRGN